jgi:hypothetical protein
MPPRILLWSKTMTFVASPDLIAFGYKVAASAAVGVIMAIVLWPFRKARKEWAVLKAEQASIHAELVTQRENCLQTLQTQGDRQIELLGKTVDILGDVRVSIAEMAGYCKANTGIGCSSKPRRHKAKK